MLRFPHHLHWVSLLCTGAGGPLLLSCACRAQFKNYSQEHQSHFYNRRSLGDTSVFSEACPELFDQDQVACTGAERASLAARGGNITLEHGVPEAGGVGTAAAGHVTVSQRRPSLPWERSVSRRWEVCRSVLPQTAEVPERLCPNTAPLPVRCRPQWPCCF